MEINKNIKYFYLIIISLIIRLFITFFYVDNYNTVEDYQIAENLAKGNGYVLYDLIGPTAIKVPLYPVMLSFFILIFNGLSKFAIVIFQHILLLFCSYFILKIGYELQKVRVSELFFLIFIFYPSYLYYPNVIEVTNVFICESIMFVYFSVKYYKLQSRQYLIILSILSGLIFLTQPIAVPIILAVWIYLLRNSITKIWVPLIVILLMQSPWIIRNYVVFDKFIPFKSPFWMNIYLGYHLPNFSNEDYDIIDGKDVAMIDSLINSYVNDVEMEQYYRDVVLRTIKKDPILYIEKTFFQIFTYWWVPNQYLNDNRLEFVIARKVPVFLLNLLTILSMVYLVRIYPKLIISMILVFLYFTLTYALTQTYNIRYKLDIEWLQFIAVTMYLERFIKKSTIF